MAERPVSQGRFDRIPRHRRALLPMILFALCAGLLPAGNAQATAIDGFGPWSATRRHPAIGPEINSRPVQHRAPASLIGSSASYGKTISFAWLMAYQRGLSKLIPSNCPMHPSCSNYSIEAIVRHGPVIGIMMTADRLFHEGTEAKFVPNIVIDGRTRYVDPVENNDFWWHTPETHEEHP